MRAWMQMKRAWVCLALLSIGCAEATEKGAVSLSIAADADTELEVGESLKFVVRLVDADGTSQDVTAQAMCSLTGDPTGSVAGDTFTAEAAGSSVLGCAHQGVQGTLVLTVRGAVVDSASVEGIQGGDVEVGSIVSVKDLVVTALAPVEGSDAIDLFVQPKQKPELGLYIYDARSSREAKLTVGDVIQVSGTYVESAMRSTVEAELIEKTGTAMPKVNPLKMSGLDLTAHESALVSVPNVAVLDPAYTSYTWLLADAEDQTLEVELDTLLFTPSAAAGVVLSTLTGVVFCSDGLCAVAPRSEADLAVCKDCAPVMPPDPPPVDAGKVEIADIQGETVGPNMSVMLEDVVVTALWPDVELLDFWAQTAGGGELSGLFFRDAREAPTALTFQVGSRVTVSGVTELRDGYVVVNFSAVEEVGTGASATADAVSAVDLVDADKGRPYWGGLVDVADLTVTAVDAAGYGLEVRDAESKVSLFVGNTLFSTLTGAPNDVLGRVRGVVYVGTSGLELWPRDAADVVP